MTTPTTDAELAGIRDNTEHELPLPSAEVAGLLARLDAAEHDARELTDLEQQIQERLPYAADAETDSEVASPSECVDAAAHELGELRRRVRELEEHLSDMGLEPPGGYTFDDTRRKAEGKK